MTEPTPEDTAPAPAAPVLCSPWANPADIPAAERDDMSDDQWNELLTVASEILWALSGRRWYGGGCTETATFSGACSCCGQRVAGPAGGPSWWVPRYDKMWFGHRGEGLKLPRDRVTPGSVTVSVNGEPFTDIRVEHTPGMIYRSDGCPWADCGEDITVSYGFGSPPPLGGKRAAIQYAIQLHLAEVGNNKCKLPQRVQTITRQAVTMTMLDPQEFIKNGQVGLTNVDTWLHSVNPRKRAERARVLIPGAPRARR